MSWVDEDVRAVSRKVMRALVSAFIEKQEPVFGVFVHTIYRDGVVDTLSCLPKGEQDNAAAFLTAALERSLAVVKEQEAKNDLH